MDPEKIEQEFREKLRETYQSHELLQLQFEEEEFVNLFAITNESGNLTQPLQRGERKLDSNTYQLMLDVYNSVVPFKKP